MPDRPVEVPISSARVVAALHHEIVQQLPVGLGDVHVAPARSDARRETPSRAHRARSIRRALWPPAASDHEPKRQRRNNGGDISRFMTTSRTRCPSITTTASARPFTGESGGCDRASAVVAFDGDGYRRGADRATRVAAAACRPSARRIHRAHDPTAFRPRADLRRSSSQPHQEAESPLHAAPADFTRYHTFDGARRRAEGRGDGASRPREARVDRQDEGRPRHLGRGDREAIRAAGGHAPGPPRSRRRSRAIT